MPSALVLLLLLLMLLFISIVIYAGIPYEQVGMSKPKGLYTPYVRTILFFCYFLVVFS